MMRIGGIGNVYPTYVYNPNTVSSMSMNKLSRISDDVLDKKVDYTESAAAEENQNPLRKGETLDFEGLVAKQMQQGQNRAVRVMTNRTPEEAPEEKAERKQTDNKQIKDAQTANKQAASEQTAAAAASSENNTTVMQMQRAIQAYEMFMTA